ncbi:MAG: hypothetical protein H6831_16065 [Planctomycetes bacterium]|nr:hypothetical protein [Planctomycetota bacterium]MCB9905916.1 hypothetical protein [Planctomycetota bacterium]
MALSPPVPFAGREGCFVYYGRVQSGDVLPGISTKRRDQLIGEQICYVRCGLDWVVPPIYANLIPIDGRHAFVGRYGEERGSNEPGFLDMATGAFTPVDVDGEVLANWTQVHVVPSGQGGKDSRVWVAGRDPLDGNSTALGVFDARGNPLSAHHGLRPRAGGPLGLVSHGRCVLAEVADPEGTPLVMPFRADGEALGFCVPELSSLELVRPGADWWNETTDEKAFFMPPWPETELAVAVGSLEDPDLVDATLYLPLSLEGRPLTLPSDALGMVRLISFTKADDSPLRVETGMCKYPRCHSGWAVVRRTEAGLVFDVAGGDAEEVLSASLAGTATRVRRWKPVVSHRLLYYWRGNADPRGGVPFTYEAVVPPRAVAERIDGRWIALDLSRGVPFPLVDGDGDERDSEVAVQIALQNGDDALQRDVYKGAVAAHEALMVSLTGLTAEQRVERARAQELERGQLRESGLRSNRDVERARQLGMDRAWVDAEADRLYAESVERNRKPDPVPVFSWQNVFDAWHVQRQSGALDGRVEVYDDRGLVRVVKYR